MRRRASVAFVGIVACGLAGAVLAAVLQRSDLAFTLGVPPSGVAVELRPGQTACQAPIGVPPRSSFEQIELQLGTYGARGPALQAMVDDARTERRLSEGTLPGGYPDITEMPRHRVRVGEVPAGSRIRVCLRNRGLRQVALYGSGGAASRTTTASVDGRPVDADVLLIFRRASERSLLDQAGAVAERASLFKAGWVKPWTFAVLGLLVALGVPLLVAHALRAAIEPDN